MVGVLEGVGTHTHHETTPNHTQRAGFPPPTAEQGSNDVKSGGNTPTFTSRFPLGLPLNIIYLIAFLCRWFQV